MTFMCGSCGHVWSDPEDECPCDDGWSDDRDTVTTAHDEDGISG